LETLANSHGAILEERFLEVLMRLAPLFASFLIAAGPAGIAVCADVILKDGRTIATSKPYVVKGKTAVLTTPDGSVFSVPVADIDTAKTAEAAFAAENAAPGPEAKGAAAEKKATTPGEAVKAAEADRAKKKKSSVVLTDRDVRPGAIYSPDGEKGEKGDGEVVISSTTETRTKTGYAIDGSVVNSGKADVRGVSVTIELVGEGRKTMVTTRGNLAKDSLAPGEKSTFTADVAVETDAKSFRYSPSWQVIVTVPVKTADPSAMKADAGKDGAATAPPVPTPPPAAASKPERTETTNIQAIPRPDVAPQAPNAAIGAPSTPGGGYIPSPSSSQANQPQAP
jgi:hypothetical protein